MGQVNWSPSQNENGLYAQMKRGTISKYRKGVRNTYVLNIVIEHPCRTDQHKVELYLEQNHSLK